MPLNRRQTLALPLTLLAPAWAWAQSDSPATVDESWVDARRQRTLPLRIRWPAARQPIPTGGRPVVLFSHGLGGNREGAAVWGEAWARAGFVVVHLQHPGSDTDAIRSQIGQRRGLQDVASAEQLWARLADVGFVLDEMQRRHAAARAGTGYAAWASIRPTAMGMSGHSFGAHTTLGMAGQSYPGVAPLKEPRLAAYAAFSPALPAAGDPQQAFAAVQRPTLCLTGTEDGDVIGNGSTPERRRAVFDALPAGHKAMLVLQGADHMTFGGQTGRIFELRRRAPAVRAVQPAQHALVAAITTDWWRAHLQGDTAAQQRLRNPSGLGPQDRWQTG
jgi:predicted dienelactone hydrolase